MSNIFYSLSKIDGASDYGFNIDVVSTGDDLCITNSICRCDLDPPLAWMGDLRYTSRVSLEIPIDGTFLDLLEDETCPDVVYTWWSESEEVQSDVPLFLGTLVDDSKNDYIYGTKLSLVHLLYFPNTWDREITDSERQYEFSRGYRTPRTLNGCWITPFCPRYDEPEPEPTYNRRVMRFVKEN